MRHQPASAYHTPAVQQAARGGQICVAQWSHIPRAVNVVKDSSSVTNLQVRITHLQCGKQHGVGKYVWPSGATYQGEWRAGSMHGVGTMTSPTTRCVVRHAP
eukprot:1157257-Pelagomonas_calceolata.AAC.8